MIKNIHGIITEPSLVCISHLCYHRNSIAVFVNGKESKTQYKYDKVIDQCNYQMSQ